MSGIAGIFNLDGRPVEPSSLEAMSAAMAHRGPDGSGSWIDGPVGLAHRMLHSTPESLREVQPLHDESSQLVLVLDGRIDNREELRAAIESSGGRLRDDTDAELVLKSYECWAEDCPKHLLGDFAFALWDARRRRLFCARDPLGNKTFFYRCDGKTFAFASEMQPLFADSRFPREIHLDTVALYLSGSYVHHEQTLYEGVLRLQASHSLTIAGQVGTRRYWDVDPGHTIRYPSDAEYAQHFLQLFREAVKARLRSPAPVAIALSGGMDSTSVACLAAQLHQEEGIPGHGISTHSVVFDKFPCDERSYIQAVLQRWPLLASRFVHYEEDFQWVDLEKAAHYPDVFYDPSVLMFAPSMRALQPSRCRVLLDGYGGDELLAAGFHHLEDLLRAGKFSALLRQLRWDANVYSTPPLSLLLNHCLRPLVPARLKALLRPLIRRLRRSGTPSLLTSVFQQRATVQARLRQRISVPKWPTRSQQAIYMGLFHGWNAQAMEMNELFYSRFSLECRHPLLDRRLVDFLLAVPEDQRWRGDEAKFVLRQAMVGVLPEAVRNRKGKTGFLEPIAWEFETRQASKIKDLIRNSLLVALGVADANRVRELFQDSPPHGQYATIHRLGALCLELWCRSVYKQQSDFSGDA